ncbi:MFS transporter [Paracoccaceae bacterium]|nr:MFS transporter [Paracoccaceae bacterium]
MLNISYILKKTIFSKEPFGLLILLAMAMPIAFSTWVALLNNFVIEVSDFSGIEIGWLQSVREIPGFLAVCVIFILFFISEQRLAYISLALLAVAVAVTALFPSFQGLILTTLISSIGFHYYETVNQSLQLQWLKKETAPSSIGWIVAAGSGSAFFVYIAIIVLWLNLNFNYFFIYFCAGALCLLIVVFCYFYYPQFHIGKKQRLIIVIKRRYWVYYTLQFFSGARRQIFVVFASFMMVEKYGFDVHQITLLLLTNFLINIFMAPLIGRFIENFGERLSLIVEYFGLMIIFLLYAGLYYFDWSYLVASVLFIADHMFFGLAFAMKTYFQKIADPEDFAPTAAVAFTINHISAVFLPVLLGYIWIYNNSAVFYLAAILSFVSLIVALLIPRSPSKGNESIL